MTTPEPERVLDAILSDPQLRTRLTAAIEKEAAATPPHWWRDRTKPFLAGLSSAAVVMLAFLVPSLQDLQDRYQTRHAVDRYAEIGSNLMQQRHYAAAEAAFDRAIELAGAQRIDLIELRMQAHVQRMEEDPEWPGSVPESLTEADFLYALAVDERPGRAHERAAVLGAYGAFLAAAQRWPEAEQRLREAIALEPNSADWHRWLGNLLGDRGATSAAESEYHRALQLAPDNVNARYNLGLLLLETGRAAQAEAEFRAYVAARPSDAQGYLRLAEALDAQGRTADAKAERSRALRLDPNAESAAEAADAADAAQP